MKGLITREISPGELLLSLLSLNKQRGKNSLSFELASNLDANMARKARESLHFKSLEPSTLGWATFSSQGEEEREFNKLGFLAAKAVVGEKKGWGCQFLPSQCYSGG